MASSRHRHAVPRRAGRGTTSTAARDYAGRHSTPQRTGVTPWRRSAARVVFPAIGTLAVLGAAAAVVVNGSENAPAAASSTVAAAPVSDDIITEALGDTPEVSRSGERPELPDADAVSVDVSGQMLALEDGVQIHADADSASPVLDEVDEGDALDVTGKEKDGWSEVVLKGVPRWVKSDQIATELPLSNAPCPKMSENGLQPDTVKLFRAVCAEFPEVASYGAIAGRGEHATGHALDIMVRGALGDRIAAFVQEHRAELGVEYIIWEQRIWRPATSNSWRGMSSRGGDTANHMDHVHVTTYGNAATG